MAEPVLEGASLPDGIEVDEAAAYFGVTESSDIVHTLMSMERNQSIGQFFSMVADIILKPGEFDFEEASQALNCEGGEIYYLVSRFYIILVCQIHSVKTRQMLSQILTKPNLIRSTGLQIQ